MNVQTITWRRGLGFIRAALRAWRFTSFVVKGVGLVPINDLVVRTGADGGVEYEATGADPQFRVDHKLGIHMLAPGWYLWSMVMSSSERRTPFPCLYTDYGDGCTEASRVPLPQPDSHGRVRGVVVISRPLRALRFDPCIYPDLFRVGKVSLGRITRAQALFELLRTTPASATGTSNAGTLASRASRYFSDALRAGISKATSMLVDRCYGADSIPESYLSWLNYFDPLVKGSGLKRTPMQVAQVNKGPLISVVVPVFNTPLDLLRSCIESVRAQSYTNWQLCIADDASTSPEIVDTLRSYAREDSRIEVVFREENGHICEATNSALALVRGGYVTFLDHDDELHADALRHVAAALEEHPQARLIYTDEDKIDALGQRFDPHFKPAWNPALLRSQNYICHLMVIDAALLEQVGMLRPGFEGAQDHDFVLRCTEVLGPHQIWHIPQTLYHWRAIPGSTALGVGQKTYAAEAGRRAVQEHLHRIGVSASVEIVSEGCYRSRIAIPETPPKVSIVIPTRDRADLLARCVSSVLDKTQYADLEIVIVDNGSTEPEASALLDKLGGMRSVRVIEHHHAFNFSALVNHGVRHASGDVICLLNNDTEVISPLWIGEMASYAVQPDVGAVGAMLYFPDGTIQHAGVVLGMGGVAGHVGRGLRRRSLGYMSRLGVVQNVSAVTAACMVVRSEVYEEAGGFDEDLAVAFNDVDFCLRLREQGYMNVWTPFAELYHHESASRGHDDTPGKQQRFSCEVRAMKRRWGDLLEHDPAYNPKLSLRSGCFDLAFPPRVSHPRAAAIFPSHRVLQEQA